MRTGKARSAVGGSHVQFSKGEQLHELCSWLWFGDGALRHQHDKQKQETVHYLNLLTNVVVVWNTVYMQEVVAQLRREGQLVADENLHFDLGALLTVEQRPAESKAAASSNATSVLGF
jgi:hypothetical protein